jgi:uncharacterized membrane-anchored protein
VKKILILLAVAAQLAVLAWMAFEREWVVRTGRTVYLRTAPVDPRDPMRGDFVRLNYEIATVPKALCRGAVPGWFPTEEYIYNAKVRDRRVYAEIRLDAEGVAELVALSDELPAEGLYLRGRATAIQRNTIDVRFGVEAFFMQQEKAKAFEAEASNEKAGVPLNMEVAVGENGLAVLKGYRWEPLGITLVLDRPPTPVDGAVRTPPPGLRGLTIELKNHGSAPQAIVVGEPVMQNFRLLPANERWQPGEEASWRWVGETTPAKKAASDQVKLLQPGESHRVQIDLTSPDWFVRKIDAKEGDGPATSIEALVGDWRASFRLEYVPPDEADSAGLPHAEYIRHVRLRSRAFSAAGGVD